MSQTLLFSRDRAGALHVLYQINELKKPGVNETVILVDLNRSACIKFFFNQGLRNSWWASDSRIIRLWFWTPLELIDVPFRLGFLSKDEKKNLKVSRNT